MTDDKKTDRQNRMSERFGSRAEQSESVEEDETDTEEAPNGDNEINDVNEINETAESDVSTTPSTTSKTSSSSTTSSESMDSSTSSDSKTVRETKARTFYLGTDRLKRLDRLYKEMSLEYEIEFEEDLPKNDAFYGAVIDAVCNRTTIEEELGLTNAAEEEEST
jgi:cobalamin biosynthesis Mg chelatase CobN